MSQFAETLRFWRQARRLSQLELALEAGVSARHISFLETGRARPSAEMIGRLGAAMALPLDARNQMLTRAGFAAAYAARDWNDAEMGPIRHAVERMLAGHAPFPGLAVDAEWTVLRLNPAAAALFGRLGLSEGGSFLELMLSDRLPALVENWPEVAQHTATRLRLESAARGGVARLDAAAAHLAQVPHPRGTSTGPVVPVTLRLGDSRLSLFSTLAQFGTPEDLLLEDLRIELFFPMDDTTEAALRALT
ncbi:MAG: helix-turn-helix transcriptional regulator [Roseicyclus sp.]|jgi:transcriptional regulator with XRE-family HTH domain|nr:helix-turn-helix transcriptional regulator [Roseicyclus sp.]